VAVADAASEPTATLPATAPPRLKFTEVAPAVAVPPLRTVADRVIALISLGDAGVHETAVTVRSGFGAATP